jgi:hypothetical protein
MTTEEKLALLKRHYEELRIAANSLAACVHWATSSTPAYDELLARHERECKEESI